MLRNGIFARYVITIEEYGDVLKDYLLFNSLSEKEKTELIEYHKIISTETPHLALKRHGIIPGDDWKTSLTNQNKKRIEFYNQHPSFCCERISKELKSILENKRVVLFNDYRKGRESINVVNVIANEQYLVFIYNRLINSTQTEVVFSGIPLEAIETIECFGFLKEFIPTKKHIFNVSTNIVKNVGEYYGIEEFKQSVLLID